MKIRFILNPKSGKEPANVEYIKKQILAQFPQADFCVTNAPKHATQLAQEAVEQKFDAVVAIGGDGTVNEVAQKLVNTQTALGIIARGSGNGFARELGLMGPLKPTLAKLKKASPQPCDVGYANGEVFLNLAGVGVEAAIAWKFMEHGANGGERGKTPYFKLGAKLLLSYKPNILKVTLNGQPHVWAPLSLVFANNRQYGNNFIIAPQAGIADGKLDMVMVQDVAKFKLLIALPFFFLGKKPPFKVTAWAQLHNAVVESEKEILYHVDGEPRKTDHRLEIKVARHALRLLIP